MANRVDTTRPKCWHAALLMASLLTSCAADTSAGERSLAELAEEEDVGAILQSLVSGNQTVDAVLYTLPAPPLAGARMYQWAATTAPVLRELPPESVVTVGAPLARNGFYQVVHAGTWGWMSGAALTLSHAPQTGLSAARQSGLALARSAMGFSYWWSNARWERAGATLWPVDNTGDCSGNCPSCTHTPTYLIENGADCSGFISTVWGFGDPRDSDPETNGTNNGYATRAYATPRPGSWTNITMANARPGDAVVYYNTTTRSGHIFLVAVARDSRGTFISYECMGCAEGCRSNANRTITAKNNTLGWQAIRRAGW